MFYRDRVGPGENGDMMGERRPDCLDIIPYNEEHAYKEYLVNDGFNVRF